MCGIGGVVAASKINQKEIASQLDLINSVQHHRGPDGKGTWVSPDQMVGLAHTRLSIIDLDHGSQPMKDSSFTITFNGEIYNYIELRSELGIENFKTTSDTEVILKAYQKWGEDCPKYLRGMFAFAIWDEKRKKLFFARDRFGIKPFYYFIENNKFYFASEIKTLLKFKNNISMNHQGLTDYFTFQFCIGDKTLFNDIYQLKPAHCGYIDRDFNMTINKYWEVEYNFDLDHTEQYFIQELNNYFYDSTNKHLRSDVEVGSYISGGIDSSLIATLMRKNRPNVNLKGFIGKFSEDQLFDESQYARLVAEKNNIELFELNITEDDFLENIHDIIYYLDQPTAGPGTFPQYMVSSLVKKHLKVVLGGQGGDEIFGGYTRYLIAYFEQCIKGAIEGTLYDGNYIVSYESIIPNLKSLRTYKPLLQKLFSEGLFEERDKRYFRLINRAVGFQKYLNPDVFKPEETFSEFQDIFWGHNVGTESYFDSMTHFDFKTLLPALLHVEDRVSMANNIESRVPFLDHPLVELAASIPPMIKFKNGELKRLLNISFNNILPDEIVNRKDKMGFPVPLQKWISKEGKTNEFVMDTFKSQKAKNRIYINEKFDIESLIKSESTFGRNIWGLLSLELWQQQFIDR
ncbi:MAG: asparagine synthase (glutamine-hydrolyzing) [Bdellovibrionales bacterium]|nr:asparagine synthase (glutamine-hydrolyzing) [Bdellovibrionales bacterium]